MAVAKSVDKNCFSVRGSHGQPGFFRIETESSVRSAQSVYKVGLNPDFAQAMQAAHPAYNTDFRNAIMTAFIRTIIYGGSHG
jgi:hypothetical protein